jgi:hypothetical protein
VSGVSFILSGEFWNGSASVAAYIEIENKVQTDGSAQLWIEELNGSGGFPFVKFFRLPTVTADSGAIVGHTNATDALKLGAYDVDGTAYKYFIVLTAGNTPSCAISQPAGGSLLISPPTADPHVAGVLWNNSGLAVISAG